MFKVGIMTWYKYENYGTALQAVALDWVIHDAGYEVQVINYRPNPIYTKEKRTFVSRLLGVYNKIKNNNTITDPEWLKRGELFSKYINDNLSETIPCNSWPELARVSDEFDAIVCGSDQIWAPVCFDDKYFLPFVKDSNKMIAYAPSLGVMSVEDPIIREQMRFLISRFKFLSVREKQGAEIISKLCNKDAKIVLDPTLLLDKNEWIDKLSIPQEGTNEYNDYLLCYFLGNTKKYAKAIQRLAKKTGLKLLLIGGNGKQKIDGAINKVGVGPCEFVQLIKNASMVCTDSFHGMAFSINFEKQFVAFERFDEKDVRNQNSRIYNLLDLCGLRERLFNYHNFDVNKAIEKYNTEESILKLENERLKSLAYLTQSIQMATERHISHGENQHVETDFCSGCGACKAVCPFDSIDISMNEEGFFSKKILDTCKNCGLCKNVCPMENIMAPRLENAKGLYSYQSVNEEVLLKSSSGGMAHCLAKKAIEKDMNVFGVGYDSTLGIAKHIQVNKSTKERLTELQGSKYLQSNCDEVVESIEKRVTEDKIMFIGTPCQVAGVSLLLEQKGLRGRAILVDLICHGVPSYLLWRKYLEYVRKQYGINGQPDVLFRSERGTWRFRKISIFDGKNSYENNEYKDMFYTMFKCSLVDNRCCYECPYRERSAADIRLGDYWGSRFRKNKLGVSMVIGITDNGVDMIKELDGVLSQHSLTEYWSVQYPYNHHIVSDRESILRELSDEKSCMLDIWSKYGKKYQRQQCTEAIKRIIKEKLLD